MQLRALCVAGLVATAAVPVVAAASATGAPASTSTERSVGLHLRLADRALKRAHKAAAGGRDTTAAASLAVVTREALAAQKTALRAVKRDPTRGRPLLASVVESHHRAVGIALELLDAGSGRAARAATTALTASRAGRASTLSAIGRLDEDDANDYGELRTDIAIDLVHELEAAADAYRGRLSSTARSAVSKFVTADASLAQAAVEGLAPDSSAGSAAALEDLRSAIADAVEALDRVPTLARRDALAVSGARSKLDAIGELLDTLAADDGVDDDGAFDDGAFDDDAADDDGALDDEQVIDDTFGADDDAGDDPPEE